MTKNSFQKESFGNCKYSMLGLGSFGLLNESYGKSQKGKNMIQDKIRDAVADSKFNGTSVEQMLSYLTNEEGIDIETAEKLIAEEYGEDWDDGCSPGM